MYSSDYSDGFTALAAISGGFMIVLLALCVLFIVAAWKIFTKAGEPGWACIVPFYNAYVMFKITWGNGLFFLLMFIPLVNAVVGLITTYKLCKVFGHGFGFFLLMLFFSPIATLILAFGDSQYQGV